jgi:hypothetical protein
MVRKKSIATNIAFTTRDHKDYHNWDDREDRSYRIYLSEHHREYRPFVEIKVKDQRNYWTWRHEHPDHDPRPAAVTKSVARRLTSHELSVERPRLGAFSRSSESHSLIEPALGSQRAQALTFSRLIFRIFREHPATTGKPWWHARVLAVNVHGLLDDRLFHVARQQRGVHVRRVHGILRLVDANRMAWHSHPYSKLCLKL